MLADRIRIESSTTDVEDVDIFADAAATLFPDDTKNSHGEAGATVIYTSPRFGDIRLTATDPSRDEERRLFAHYLWNAGVYAADQIEGGAWDVSGKRVLELGAGLGLVSIVAAMMDAKEVLITDYPAPDIIETLCRNVHANVLPACRSAVKTASHIWGELDDPLSTSHAQSFDVIVAADCFWMPWEHRNLARSMLHFLSLNPHARVYAVAAFHTGRAKLAPFFETALSVGLSVESIQEIDTLGNTRPWALERDGGKENVTERKKWLVVAVLERDVRGRV